MLRAVLVSKHSTPVLLAPEPPHPAPPGHPDVLWKRSREGPVDLHIAVSSMGRNVCCGLHDRPRALKRRQSKHSMNVSGPQGQFLGRRGWTTRKRRCPGPRCCLLTPRSFEHTLHSRPPPQLSLPSGLHHVLLPGSAPPAAGWGHEAIQARVWGHGGGRFPGGCHLAAPAPPGPSPPAFLHHLHSRQSRRFFLKETGQDTQELGRPAGASI